MGVGFVVFSLLLAGGLAERDGIPQQCGMWRDLYRTKWIGPLITALWPFAVVIAVAAILWLTFKSATFHTSRLINGDRHANSN